MIYCRKCRKKHRGDKSRYQILEQANHSATELVDLLMHFARKHNLVDFRVFPGEVAAKPELLIKVLNSKDKLSRKQKKLYKKQLPAFEKLDF